MADATSRAPAPEAGVSTELRRNTLTTHHVAVMAMAGTGPASVIALNLAFMGVFAGKALVFAFVLVLVVILLLTNTFVEFSRRIPSAGSMFAWNTRAFGPSFGFLYGWFFAGSYLILSSAGFVVLGGWAESYFASHVIHADIPWWIWTLVGIGYTGTLAWLGVTRSLRSALILLGFELAVMIALGIWMVGSVPAAQAFDSTPFRPGSSLGGWAGIGLAMTFGVLSMVGYEEAATLAEETRDSQRAVARGLWVAAVAIPIFYILMSYAVVVGYGNIHKFSGDDAALQTLGARYWGGGVGLAFVVIAVLSSILAFSQTSFNAGVRVIYALGRERLLPHRMAHTGRYRTPAAAIAVWMLIVIAAGMPLGFITKPFDVWGYFGFMISIAFLIVYLLTNFALIKHIRTHSPHEFSVLRHLILPLAGAVGVAYPLYRTIHPLPPSPYVYLPWVIVAWALIGGVVLIYLRMTRPESIAEVGRSLALTEEEPPEAEPVTSTT